MRCFIPTQNGYVTSTGHAHQLPSSLTVSCPKSLLGRLLLSEVQKGTGHVQPRIVPVRCCVCLSEDQLHATWTGHTHHIRAISPTPSFCCCWSWWWRRFRSEQNQNGLFFFHKSEQLVYGPCPSLPGQKAKSQL